MLLCVYNFGEANLSEVIANDCFNERRGGKQMLVTLAFSYLSLPYNNWQHSLGTCRSNEMTRMRCRGENIAFKTRSVIHGKQHKSLPEKSNVISNRNKQRVQTWNALLFSV